MTSIDLIVEEIHSSSASELQAYLQGALKDGTWSRRHGTHRIGQADREWIELIQRMLCRLNCSAWIYREGRSRNYWIVETSAPFLAIAFDPTPLIGSREAISYARGYFDAEGGMPRDARARLYIQLVQKNRGDLASLRAILIATGIDCGKFHVPSRRIDPNLWRFYVLAGSHGRFMEEVGSWHPRKRALIHTRLMMTSVTFRTSPAFAGT